MLKSKLHPKVLEAIVVFNQYIPFYAEILSRANIIETEKQKTAYMCYRKRGLEIGYNRAFIDSLSEPEVNYILCHEIKHALAEHTSRRMGRNSEISNVAEDAIIDSTTFTTEVKHYPKFFQICKYNEVNVKVLYPEHYKDLQIQALIGQNIGSFIPKEYVGNEITELLYDWLIEQMDKKKDNNKDGEKTELSKGYGNNGRNKEECQGTEELIDDLIKRKHRTLDEHIPDDCTPEERNAMLNEIIDSCRNRGLISSEMEATLKKLRPSKKDYTKYVCRKLSQLLGGKRYNTWMRENRRDLPYQGHKKGKYAIVVGLDTSGSMSDEFETVLSTIYKNGVEIILIQGDTEIKKIDRIKNKYKLESLKISGLGGTILQPIVDLVKQKYSQFPFVLLTDGECDDLDFSGFKNKALILYTQRRVYVSGHRNVMQIRIEK